MKITNKQLADAFVSVVEGKDRKEVQSAADEFVKWLAQRNLQYRLREIVKSLDQVWIEKYGAANILVQSAHKLTMETSQKLQTVAKGADVSEIVDKELIGGARVRIDERIIDGSVQGKLTRLRTALEN